MSGKTFVYVVYSWKEIEINMKHFFKEILINWITIVPKKSIRMFFLINVKYDDLCTGV